MIRTQHCYAAPIETDSKPPLSAEHHALLERLLAFSFDDGVVALPFAVRLARENGWSRRYAERVLVEYRRFMFLLATAGHPVTPSDQVDQAWHLHLIYTQSYWNRFCADVLRQRADHGPTEGGQQEAAKFHCWYAWTLKSYRRVFGAPPEDIWPGVATRFGEDVRHVRVNVVRNCIIPRARIRILYVAAFLLAIVLAVSESGLLGCDGLRLPAIFDLMQALR